MPELPDIEVYVHALSTRAIGQILRRVRVFSPFMLRTFEPPVEAAEGCVVREVRRLGKRIVFELHADAQAGAAAATIAPNSPAKDTNEPFFLVLHLMIAGRLRWLKAGAAPPRGISLAAMEFDAGTLAVTEAGSKKRAALHVVHGAAGLREFERGGLEVLEADESAFHSALVRENHTLKRALTDPRLFSGIGNAYSDEILHAARLSPLAQTQKLSEDEISRLFLATRETLRRWAERLIAEFGERFPGPGQITAFRPDFAVHGKFGQPCPACGTPVQRIRYAENETNYCPRCQTGGRVLADRSLSRLLKDDWPRTVEELERP